MRGLGARGVGGAADRRLGPAPLTAPSSRSSFQQRLSYTTLSDLALALLDGTVFEIVQGLLDIQHLTEKSLYNQRLRLQNEHRGARGRRDGPAPRARARPARAVPVSAGGGLPRIPFERSP